MSRSGHFAHIDEADLTINTCIGGDFTGADLLLTVGSSSVFVPQSPGVSIVHNGNTPHKSGDVVGFRQNLIRSFLLEPLDSASSDVSTVFFSVESSFHQWKELPADVKAHIFTFAPNHRVLLQYEMLNKDARAVCRDHGAVVWGHRYKAAFKKAPAHPAQAKQDFIEQCVQIARSIPYFLPRPSGTILLRITSKHWRLLTAILYGSPPRPRLARPSRLSKLLSFFRLFSSTSRESIPLYFAPFNDIRELYCTIQLCACLHIRAAFCRLSVLATFIALVLKCSPVSARQKSLFLQVSVLFVLIQLCFHVLVALSHSLPV